MNTRLTYMYRDASNYKNYATVVFRGEISDTQRGTVTAALDDGERFLPGQVGLATLQHENPSHYDDDHIWHEILTFESTSAQPTEDLDVRDFAACFTDVTWDVETATAQLEAWKQHSPRGPLNET